MLTRSSFFPKWFFVFLTISLVFIAIGLMPLGGGSGWSWLYRSTQPSFFSLENRLVGVFRGHLDDKSNQAGLGLRGQARLDQYRLDNARLREENQRARKLLGAGPPLDFKFEPAVILGWRGGKMRLSGGRNRGFKEGLAVVGENRLLGKLISVQEYTSEVQLVADGDFRLAVGVWRPDGDLGQTSLVAKGILKGGRRPLAEEVLKGEWVEKGFLVAPLGFPGRFFVGRVTAVSSPRGGFKKFFVDWEGRKDVLGTVFVVTNGLLP